MLKTLKILCAMALLTSTSLFANRIEAITELPSLSSKFCVPSILRPSLAEQGHKIRRFRVNYVAQDGNGVERKASGLLAFQDGDFKDRKLVFYNHVTVYDRYMVPSYLSKESQFATCSFLKEGEILVAPDQFGLGDSPGFHPFLHIPSEIAAGRSFLELMIDQLKEWKFSISPQIILSGYSAGAHSSLALLYDLEDRPLKTGHYSTQFLAMCGPFDLVGLGKRALFIEPKKFNAAMYAAYIVMAYQEVYGDIFDKITDIVKPGYENLDQIMWTQNSVLIEEFLPEYPQQLFKKSFIDELTRNPQHPLNIALRKNSLGARPISGKIDFFFTDGDRSVLAENSKSLAWDFLQLGTEVTLSKVSRALGHRNAYVPVVHQAGKAMKR